MGKIRFYDLGLSRVELEQRLEQCEIQGWKANPGLKSRFAIESVTDPQRKNWLMGEIIDGAGRMRDGNRYDLRLMEVVDYLNLVYNSAKFNEQIGRPLIRLEIQHSTSRRRIYTIL